MNTSFQSTVPGEPVKRREQGPQERERDTWTSNEAIWSEVAQREEPHVAVGIRTGFMGELVKDGPRGVPSITSEEKGFWAEGA